jgi:hypothetical protein
MTKSSPAIQKQVEQALKEKDANKLDLALRSQYHFQNRGKEVDTTTMEFAEVKQINPQFYG